jgi:purine-binding chemotaxis protein CheW
MSAVIDTVDSTTRSPERASPAPGRVAAPAGEYLTYALGREAYAVAIRGVQEIRGYVEPTRIAGAPAHLKGVMNLRGTIVPIVDLRILSGDAAPAYDAVTATIILDSAGRSVGVVVDSVMDVLELQPQDIKPAPECTSRLGGSHICGIATQTQGESTRLVILVDAQQLLSDADLPASAAALL